MARVTVEDCLNHVDNRFNLVILASKRARQISYGKDPFVEIENDKVTVVALREIAEGKVNMDIVNQVDNEHLEEEETEVPTSELPKIP